MRYMMDRTGKVLAFDGERLSFKLLRCLREDEAVYFCSRTGTLFHKGAECYLDESLSRFMVSPLPNDDIVFEISGHFLSIYSCGILLVSSASGEIQLTNNRCSESLFFLLSEEMFRLLHHFFESGITYEGETRRREIKVHDFIIDDGENKFSLQDNTHVSLRDDRLILMAEEVVLIEVKKFRPLIYFCAFGGQEYLETLFLSMRSYVMFSKTKLNFIIFTNLQKVEIPSDLRHIPISVVRLPSVALISRYYRRYSADVVEHFHEYSPIVYSDADIICNNDITDMLHKVHSSRKFFIACECGRRSREFVLRSGWFIGSFLMRDKSLSEDEVLPINSGFFAFRSVQEFTTISRAMKLISHNILKMEGFHHSLLDQSSLNYVLMKFCDYDSYYLNDIVTTWPDSDFSKIKRSGVVHFCGHGNLLGTFESKEDGLKAYYDYVQAFLEEDRKAALVEPAEEVDPG